MQHRTRPFLWGIVCLAGASLIGALLHINTHPTPTIAQDQPCPEDWYNVHSGPMFERCKQDIANRQATGMSLEETQAMLGPTVGIPTPWLGAVTPHARRAAVNTIYQVDPFTFADSQFDLRGANSMWHIAALPSDDPDTYSHLYLLARPMRSDQEVTFCLAVSGRLASEVPRDAFSGCWSPPQPIGNLIINNVTGPTTNAQGPMGTVAFTTTTGASGTFDLATHVWTIIAAGTPTGVARAAPTSSASVSPMRAVRASLTSTPVSYPAP